MIELYVNSAEDVREAIEASGLSDWWSDGSLPRSVSAALRDLRGCDWEGVADLREWLRYIKTHPRQRVRGTLDVKYLRAVHADFAPDITPHAAYHVRGPLDSVVAEGLAGDLVPFHSASGAALKAQRVYVRGLATRAVRMALDAMTSA